MITLAARNVQGGTLGRASYPLSVAAWEPSDLGTDLVEDWGGDDASYYVLNGSDYSEWTGRKAVADLTQTTASKQPLQVTGAWNSNAIARFTRTNADLLNVGATSAFNTSAGQGVGFFCVMNITAYAGTHYVSSHYTNSKRLETYTLNSTTLRTQTRNTAGSSRNQDLTIAVGTPFAFFHQLKDNGYWDIWFNGVQQATGYSGGALSAATHSGTAFGGRFNDTLHSNVELGRQMITRDLDNTQIGELFDWAETKFSLVY